jgi:ABC-type glycerol-3-phosphate transport system substrate-binding protein
MHQSPCAFRSASRHRNARPYQPALEALDAAHPEWDVKLKTVPQEDFFKDLNAQIAAGTLPDVVRVPGLLVQQWLWQGAFLGLQALLPDNGTWGCRRNHRIFYG